MKSRIGSVAVCGFLVLLLMLSGPSFSARALSNPVHPQSSSLPEQADPELRAHETTIHVPEVSLRDSYGREQQLTALLGNRTAVIGFVFTSCRAVCPVLSAVLRASEQQLGDRLGAEMILVSISVDPQHDTPDTLRTYATALGAGPHWHWLTGAPVEIGRTLRAFGVPTGGRPDDHPPMVVVGNAVRGRWFRWVGVPTPRELVEAAKHLSKN
jgi:protein SCO1